MKDLHAYLKRRTSSLLQIQGEVNRYRRMFEFECLHELPNVPIRMRKSIRNKA